MEGFERGQDMRAKMDQRKLAKDNRQALEKIETDAQAAFKSEVDAGNEDGKNYDQFWKKYALPKRKTELLKQGDIAGAKQLEEWGNSDAALQGGRLFSSAMLKAQTGDAGGALADVIKAGQVQGYIEHGYELVGQDELVDEQGNTIGYKLRVRDQDGKELEQDILSGDVPRMISTFANPDAAWQSQVAKRAEAEKRKEGLEDFETKEGIKKKYGSGTDDAKAYNDARKALEENDLDFGDMSAEDQDAAVRERLASAEGYANERGGVSGGGSTGRGKTKTSPAPRKEILVDETTGERLPDPEAAVSPRQTDAAPGLGGGEAPPPAEAAPGLGGAPTPSPKPAPARQETRAAPTRQEIIADAADHMVNGGNAELVGQRLLQAGIPEDQWPPVVRQGMKKSTAIGLGQ
ncbi:hypothetical protein MAXJ12_08449 [Mesorhizobium alhagi CCNWXJ12-2]|uniref:Uncharacterized protein n=2 Tax=Allomesorhizobium alhagi TaxID=475067 RepID=H0HNG7_9HYPH|nr:hypothetical protein MAXJ12_08449 [Mesorhizobium alhagi CCNWXJ12-2]